VAETAVREAPLRIGIIGGGAMGRKHAETIGREAGAQLVAVADPASRELADMRNVPHFTGHGALLAAGGVDAVIIANPNTFHVATALDCLEAGVPSLLEKPVATSYAEATRLVRAVEAGSTPVLAGHHRRHHPAVKSAKDLIASGALGSLVAVNGTWLTKKADGYFDEAWRRRNGAGVMLINLVHDLDLFRHLCGEIVSVQALASNGIRGFEVEDTAAVIVQFENGALGSFVISDAVVAPWGWDQATEDDPAFPLQPTVSCYQISGTRGSLAVPQLARYYHESVSDWSQPLSMRFVAKGVGDSYSNQLRHFIEVARGVSEPSVTVGDAARSVALIEAAKLAASSGVSVQIEAVIHPA
jgi:predicted dehydrogenase